MSIGEFNRSFKSNDDCKAYLYRIKWENGYQCRKCGHDKSYKGETNFHLRCQQCDYGESATANTLFHKIKFPLLKAFGIAFIVAVRKKGMSTLELSRTFSIHQKTAWLFKRKIQEGMRSSSNKKRRRNQTLREFRFGGGGNEVNSKFSKEEKIAEIQIEKTKNKISRIHARVKEENGIVEKTTHVQKPDSKQFSGIDIILLNLQNWLRGIHHHCSGRFAKGYLDEFFFRFNMRDELDKIWSRLIVSMMNLPPYFYRANEA